ncbi:hypothetical protein CEXT_798101 [Caerostris extrusa]|uniref:Uncharacterized protein n=1 Tax=Caerostris extrusa TaxID=172846 RepID=A0AAV4V881_CAEEX|nr:hypothetical protein CEXT_798101 [Caerostris extrusa]
MCHGRNNKNRIITKITETPATFRPYPIFLYPHYDVTVKDFISFESPDNSFPQPFERYPSARLHQPRLFNPREELSLQIRSLERRFCVLLPLKFI